VSNVSDWGSSSRGFWAIEHKFTGPLDDMKPAWGGGKPMRIAVVSLISDLPKALDVDELLKRNPCDVSSTQEGKLT
jgi:hypothetical protein